MLYAGLLLALQIEWLDRLPERTERLILYREVACACSDASCPYLELARRPVWLDDDETRALVAGNFICVAARAGAELHDLALGPARGPLRTYILTPGRWIVQRLDLCAWSGDLAGELDFATLLRICCFDRDGRPEPDAERVFRKLHADHAKCPKEFHKRLGGAPAAECRCAIPAVGGSGSRRPWAGYGRGIPWHTDLEEAQLLAGHEKKPLLYFQIVGDLAKEGC